MIDIISLSIAIGAVLVGILSHIRHSECFGIKIDTRTPKNTPPSSPQIIDANLKSSIDDFLPQKKSSTFSSDIKPKKIIKSKQTKKVESSSESESNSSSSSESEIDEKPKKIIKKNK